MSDQAKILLGSNTAKNGFKNEYDVILKFNNWKTDEDAQKCLITMGYKIEDIEKVLAIKITGSFKTDVQVQITIYFKEAIDAQNISIKLVSNPSGFNQIDKRWVNKYTELWSIPDQVVQVLKYYTGELPPKIIDPRDARRMFLDEFPQEEQESVINFFENNRSLILTDILKGRGQFASEWLLVALNLDNVTTWTMLSMNESINIFNQGSVQITKQGNLKIGKVSMQRKGGDGGRPTANMLQFKINPLEILK
jgi:R.HinP1I restriction endonuclease